MKNEFSNTYNKEIGKFIKEGMLKKEYSFEMLSEELKKQSGMDIPKSSLYRYASGKHTIPQDKYLAICKALCIDPDEGESRAFSAIKSESEFNNYHNFLKDESWNESVDWNEPLESHLIDIRTITKDEALLIGYYRDASQERKSIIRSILGMKDGK